MTAFGIDFGTTNSVLAAANGTQIETVALDSPPGEWGQLGFDRVLPTVIAEEGGQLRFGWAAKRSRTRLDAVKRLFASAETVTIGTKTMAVEEAAAVFFRQIQQRASSAGYTLDQAVVTIPANSRGAARFRTKVSAGLSGIEVLALVNEPTAAAMAYGPRIGDGERLLVFDWGGGTLDVTVLRSVGGVFLEEASKGIQRLGGLDVDTALIKHLQTRLPSGAQIDPFDLERAKVLLSTQESTVVTVIGGSPIEVTRAELEQAVWPLIVRTGEPIDRCLADMGGARINHLILVGGSSKIPALQRYVREKVRLEPMVDVDPMTAIAEGAALAAGILTGQVTDYDFFLSTEHALGTVVHNDGSEKGQFSVLIPRNTKLPASATDAYNPVVDDATMVRLKVIEGDPQQPIDHEDNVILKEWEVQLLEPRPVALAGFNIIFAYDVDGILRVKVIDGLTQTVMMDDELTFGAAKTKRDLVDLRRKIDAAVIEGPTTGAAQDTRSTPLSPASQASIGRLFDKVRPHVDDEEQQRIDQAIGALRAAAGTDDEDPRRDDVDRLIRAHAYLL